MYAICPGKVVYWGRPELTRHVHDGLVYVSGTGASNNTAAGVVRELSAREEVHQAVGFVAAVLRAAGSAPDCVVIVTMLLANNEDCAEWNLGYLGCFAKHFGLELPSRSSALWAVPPAVSTAWNPSGAAATAGPWTEQAAP